jgi:hypothetical protein
MSFAIAAVSVKDDADVPGNWMPLHLSGQPPLVKSVDRSDYDAPQATETLTNSGVSPEKIRFG